MRAGGSARSSSVSPSVGRVFGQEVPSEPPFAGGLGHEVRPTPRSVLRRVKASACRHDAFRHGLRRLQPDPYLLSRREGGGHG